MITIANCIICYEFCVPQALCRTVNTNRVTRVGAAFFQFDVAFAVLLTYAQLVIVVY